MIKSRNLWSEEEDSTLRREVAKQVAAKGEVKDWRGPAAALPGRNNKDCRKRWLKLQNPVNKGAWNEDENNRLREAVRVHGNQWIEVAKSVGTRHADQCAKRWLHFLDPDLDYSEWTEQEDEHLVTEVENNGRNWRKIVNEVLPGRSATDAKNRYVMLQRSKQSRKGFIDNKASQPSQQGSLSSNISDCSRASWSPSDDCEDLFANFDPQEIRSPKPMATVSEEAGATETLCPVNSFEEMLADQQEYEFDSTIFHGPMELPHQCPLMASQSNWYTSTVSSSKQAFGFSRQPITDFVSSGPRPSDPCTSRGSDSSAALMNDFGDSVDKCVRSAILSVNSEASSVAPDASSFSVDPLMFADPFECSDTDQWATYPAIPRLSPKGKSDRFSDGLGCPNAQNYGLVARASGQSSLINSSERRPSSNNLSGRNRNASKRVQSRK